MKLRKFMFSAGAILLLVLMSACAGGGNEAAQTPEPPVTAEAPSAADELPPGPQNAEPPEDEGMVAQAPVTGEVVVTLDYEKQSGSASNQYAVWIEDLNGNLIKTLYATRWTANGGYKSRPDSIALWVEKTDLGSMPKSEVDAVSGATPRAGTQSYTWDLTDIDGAMVPPGDYRFFVEGTLRWKNYVLYSGAIPIGSDPSEARGVANFVYEGSDRYGALTEDSPENNMIANVIVTFDPDAGS